MSPTDIIIIYAQSIYEDRRVTLLPVPQPASGAADDCFTEFLELLEISCYLTKNGYSACIIDLPYLMKHDRRFDLENYIKKLDASAFVIEAGSVTQIPAALEASAAIKKYHSDSRVMLYGKAAFAYHKDLITSSGVDMIMRGIFDGDAAVQFLKALPNNRFPKISSLVWKDKRGTVHDNVLMVKSRSTHINISKYYTEAIAQKIKYRDSGAVNILHRWLSHPSAGIHKTGSAADFRTPEDIYSDILEICRFSSCEVLIKGDIRLPGRHFAERLLSLLQHKTVSNTLVFEISMAADDSYIHEIARSVPQFRLNIIPGSHDEKLRKKVSYPYSNADLESTIAAFLKAMPVKACVSFLAGLPAQTTNSVKDTVGYCEYLLRRFDGDRRLSVSISSYPPSLDTPLLENLERYGYLPDINVPAFPLEAYTCMEKNKRKGHSKSGMNAEQVALSVYEAMIKLARLENKYGQLLYRDAEILAMDYESALKMTERLYRAMKLGRYEEIHAMKPELIQSISESARDCVKNAGLLVLSRPQNALALCRAVIDNRFGQPDGHRKYTGAGVKKLRAA